MMIKISKFGELLNSRPAGKEAYLVVKAYVLPQKNETIELDFSGVKVTTPSWLDEFLTSLRQEFGRGHVLLKSTENPSVQASLAVLPK